MRTSEPPRCSTSVGAVVGSIHTTSSAIGVADYLYYADVYLTGV
jgi:hypothetical protein